MEDLKDILAKSQNYGSLTLLDHTQQVKEAIEKFAKHFQFDFDVEKVIYGAILHDLGKAHPHFQRKIKKVNGESLQDNLEWDFIHRHEISSLAFLPLFPKDDWRLLIDMVIGHHKSIENDPSGRGIIDLKSKDRDWKKNHLKNWNDWKKYGFAILEYFRVQTRDISEEEAGEALEYAKEYCDAKGFGWSPLRGLLKAADHFASAFMGDTSKQLNHLFEKPDLKFYHDEERKSNIYPLSNISTNDNRPHTLVVAPTGAGKTDFLLRRCTGRVFYTLPFQASINAMYDRIKKTVPNKDIRLLHATSKIVAKNRLDEQILQPLVGSAVKILTPHQLAAIVFGTSGFESVMLDVQGTDIILDEIHTYSDYSRAMVIEIVKALLRLDCRLHIGTATMPSILYNELLKILGGTENTYEVKLSNNVLKKFNRHQVYKFEDATQINTILQKAFEAKEKVLVIYNTVGQAQQAFLDFEKAFPATPKMLIHSRYRRGDRVNLEIELTEDFNKKTEACLVVSTQVVEVSLDISFDRMITQAAPLDSLIQRFGRVNRKRTTETIGKYRPIHVLAPQGKVKPYKMENIKASFKQLPDNGEILEETTLQTKIDLVYPKLDMKEIDIHLIYRHDKFGIGKYNLKELTNNKRAVLVEALEIESATCILSSDRDKYLTANWEERLQMEIPVNYKTIALKKNEYEQLEVGSFPFVVPHNLTEYLKIGLVLVEHETII